MQNSQSQKTRYSDHALYLGTSKLQQNYAKSLGLQYNQQSITFNKLWYSQLSQIVGHDPTCEQFLPF